MKRLALPISRKYAESVAEAIAGCARVTPSGASDLSHILIVVPTLESSRQLRLSLTRLFPRGVLPPEVTTPARLLTAGDGVASRVNELVELAKFIFRLDAFDYPALLPGKPSTPSEDWSVSTALQLLDLWRIIGANALCFADVARRLPQLLKGETADVEIARWQDLAKLEDRFFDVLHKVGLLHPVEAMRKAIATPDISSSVEAIYIATDGLAMGALEKVVWPIEPTELVIDENPLPALTREDIFPSATMREEALHIADYMSQVAPGDALPAICLADADMFPELHGALESKGLKAHNPIRQLVVTSSLGHLVAQILALFRSSSYTIFSAFVRGGDVGRWLSSVLGFDEARLIAAIVALDDLQAAHLPETFADVRRFAAGDLKAICDLTADHLATARPLAACRLWLQEIFKSRPLTDGDSTDDEFVAAAQAVNDLFTDFASLDGLGRLELPLFEKLFREASYSLEPDEGDLICTEGWLELPFLTADEVIVTGFQEGVVPESVVGHPFLPDALRVALGLESNEHRANRDARILAKLCASRPHHAVKVFFHTISSQGDVLKPSRLLFLTDDDGELATRAKTFYSDKIGTKPDPPADLPEGWRLNLPVPPKGGPPARITPSALDDYLTCPFTYYLARVFGEPMEERIEELDPARYGTLCHDALERWGTGPLRDSEDASAIARELAQSVDAILQDWFGLEVPAIVALQGESAKSRLAHFATVQAAWHASGWRIVKTEQSLVVRYGATEVRGRSDRIDFNPTTGLWCVIDYKVYDTLAKAAWYQTSAKTVAYQTELRQLPGLMIPTSKDKFKPASWASVQLPLYCAMLDASQIGELANAHLTGILSCYCVLGKTASETGFTEPMTGAYVPDAEKVVQKLISDLGEGRFWPPAPGDAWRYKFSDLIFNTPEDSVRSAWIRDQEGRR